MKQLRMILDIAMTVLMPLLMAYSLIGETFHEIIGTLIFILFTIHHVLNRKWSGALFKGRYSPGRVFRTGINALLFAFMILQSLSGILMSKHLYTFIQVQGVSSLMRQIHMALAYWGFALMSIHAGTHLQPMFRKLMEKKGAVGGGSMLLTALICLYGAYAFIKRQIPSYMFLKNLFAYFDFSESRVLFILDYLAVMILFAVIGLLITAGLTNTKKRTR